MKIDPNSGRAKATRDTAKIRTDFDYDREGRFLLVKPRDSACTEYTLIWQSKFLVQGR